MWILLTFFFSLARNIWAFEVGPEFDPHDADDWELNYGFYPWRSFQSFDLIAPAPRKAVDSPACHDGLYTFITPRGYAVDTPGNAILDNHGDLVWAQATDGQAYDFRVQEFLGEQYLSYWVGDDRVRGHGSGEYIMLNSSYQEAFRISAHNGLAADLHELILTPEGTALITVYEPLEKDLGSLKEREAGSEPTFIWDCLFQEIDVVTDELLFEWRASEHYDVESSFHNLGDKGSLDDPFDYFHINSIQKDEFGNYLISARYTHSVTYIDGETGEVLWVLGGTRNQFTDLSDGNATDFAWQHDARFHSLEDFPELMSKDIQEGQRNEKHNGQVTKLLTVFDNAAEDMIINNVLSRGLLLEISFPNPNVEDHNSSSKEYTARFIRSFDHPSNVLSSSQGSLQVIPSTNENQDPKIMIGYGYNAVFTEYDSNGTVLCDTRFGTNLTWTHGEVQSYRAFKFPWVGKPVDSPSAVMAEDGEAIYVSWNGATEVQRWILEHSTSMLADAKWQKLVTAEKHGFENELEFDQDTSHRFLRVRAVDKHSGTLGTSRIFDLGWPSGIADTIPGLHGSTQWSPTILGVLFVCSFFTIAAVYAITQQLWRWNRNRRVRNRGLYLYSPVLPETTEVEHEHV